MKKMLVATVAVTAGALFVACPPAFAQAPTTGTPQVSGAAASDMTDARVNIVKAALQLTPDQEKLWPAVEDAIRTRAPGANCKRSRTNKRVARSYSCRNLARPGSYRLHAPARGCLGSKVGRPQEAGRCVAAAVFDP